MEFLSPTSLRNSGRAHPNGLAFGFNGILGAHVLGNKVNRKMRVCQNDIVPEHRLKNSQASWAI
jgi:hypothetical protein